MKRLFLFLLMMLVATRSVAVSAGDGILDYFNRRFSEAVRNMVNAIVAMINAMKDAALTIGRVLGGALIAIGAVLWASDLFSYKGKRLIISGIILLIILELLLG
ncbi:MAG: hypothetical protein ACP5JF_03335 [Candidatus Methanodesulfokora sp.]